MVSSFWFSETKLTFSFNKKSQLQSSMTPPPTAQRETSELSTQSYTEHETTTDERPKEEEDRMKKKKNNNNNSLHSWTSEPMRRRSFYWRA
jgi:hypothetical protein